jgi:hypothetical protein
MPLPETLPPPTLARSKDDRKHQAHVPQVEGRRMAVLARVEYSAACMLISDMLVCATYEWKTPGAHQVFKNNNKIRQQNLKRNCCVTFRQIYTSSGPERSFLRINSIFIKRQKKPKCLKGTQAREIFWLRF